MGPDRGMVMEVEGVRNMGKMGMLSCMRVGIGMLVCVLVLVVVVVLVVVLVLDGTDSVGSGGVLVVVIAAVIVQGILVEVDCVGMVSGLLSGSFVGVVVLEGFGLELWSSWRMALWFGSERGDFLGHFKPDVSGGNMLVGEGACLRNGDSVRIFGFFRFF